MAKTKQPRTLARATGKDHHMAQQSHDILMQAALVVARKRLAEGGISVGAVLASDGQIGKRGHKLRDQVGSAIKPAALDAIVNARRLKDRG